MEHSEDFNEEENLKNENEFLKIKLMLEHDAKFETSQPNIDLPDETENEFLNYIMAYEKQAAERKTIKVFDRIEKPHHFKPVNKIADDEIDGAWHELGSYLNKYNIDLAVCSPSINTRELYRFATEELFDYEMNDIFIPGGMTCFTYDEFYPDPIYENTNIALDDCIRVWINLYRAGNAVFAQQVQRGVGRAIGQVFSIVRLGAGELVIGMEAGDLQFAFQVQHLDHGIGLVEKIVVVQEILQHLRMHQQSGVNLISRRVA